MSQEINIKIGSEILEGVIAASLTNAVYSHLVLSDHETMTEGDFQEAIDQVLLVFGKVLCKMNEMKSPEESL
ncbi:MAG: hypothetical protein A2W05_03125 [Candidatus Schekmanbacteria bacterium RBG_16_38_10]|uniref:Uncharacterized protein n=1 Tax=Candidatus Schekmanbacteria bacterium RBG_16_38_10 TaxID=1817879 RepID=A0A1F7RML6_9BACT|nr:MAG: hypothetical protein A2W05_03125 [Candidatus Schekmanbacteria bacterium RBG_16_38_10]